MIKIHKKVDDIFSIGTFLAIQYTFLGTISPKFTGMAFLTYLGDSMLKAEIRKIKNKNQSRWNICLNYIFRLYQFISTKCLVSYFLKNSVSEFFNSKRYDQNSVYILTQSVLAVSRLVLASNLNNYDKEGYISLGTSKLYRTSIDYIGNLSYNYFCGENIEMNSLGKLCLLNFLIPFNKILLTDYVNDGLIYPLQYVGHSFTCSAVFTTSAAMLLGVGSLDPSYKIELSSTLGSIAVNTVSSCIFMGFDCWEFEAPKTI
jgi:hypothetical protein